MIRTLFPVGCLCLLCTAAAHAAVSTKRTPPPVTVTVKKNGPHSATFTVTNTTTAPTRVTFDANVQYASVPATTRNCKVTFSLDGKPAVTHDILEELDSEKLAPGGTATVVEKVTPGNASAARFTVFTRLRVDQIKDHALLRGNAATIRLTVEAR